MNDLIQAFAVESDNIENEVFNPLHLYALKCVIYNDLTEKNLLSAHKEFAPGKVWSGKYRDWNVTVGGRLCPGPHLVKELMHNFFLDLPNMDSYEAHVRFEKIHPFQDGNGRMGRAIWLKKELDAGFELNRSFLHEFYYQTLSHSK